MVQDYLYNSSVPAAGLILTGGFLQRTYLWPNLHYTVPTLTIGGELDGLSRVTRTVEAFYQQITLAGQAEKFPVVILPGVSHFQVWHCVMVLRCGLVWTVFTVPAALYLPEAL